MTQSAKEIGDFITGFLTLREELAIAYLDQARCSDARPKEAIAAIQEQLVRFFSLQAFRIDGFLPESATPYPITQSGPDAFLLTQPDTKWNPYRTIHQEVIDARGNPLGMLHLARSQPFSSSERELTRRLAALCTEVFERWQKREIEKIRKRHPVNGQMAGV